jgi:hypothetical protein
MERDHAEPPDLIIDRYLPNATPEQRVEARAALLRHARLLVRWGERALLEQGKDSPEIDGRRRVDAPPL